MTKAILTFSAILYLAATSVLAAETGREAEIVFRDGRVIKCIVMGYAAGSFQIEEPGSLPRSVPITEIAMVKFGEAAGESVRGPLDPPRSEPTTSPATAAPEEEPKRPLDEELKLLNQPQLMGRLWVVTGRFRDHELLKVAEAELRRRIKTAAETARDGVTKGVADRNNRLALAIIKAAQNDLPAAAEMIHELKRDYPDDIVIRKLTPPALAKSIKRWRTFEPARPLKREPGLPPTPPKPTAPDEEP